jgi:alkanesulfonate monooxygenase SsuD/methylene tetrahydromethanopterin reductase-like flavin-dependent oxidoreductase (luciferase family)
MAMKCGFVLPGGTANHQLEQAIAAEEAGWDAVFVWEAAYGVDAWSLLAAMAQRTSRIRLGTMLTPLPWRRPWKVASQAVTLDALSGGRAILAVGLGAVDPGLGTTGEVTDRKERADLLDEGIDIIAALWSGDYLYKGAKFDVDLAARMQFFGPLPRPVQQPRIPIWCVAKWPHPKSMRRILRFDGLLPYADELTPDVVRDMIAWLDTNGGRRDGFDVIQEGETPADDAAAAAEVIKPWADAGATWWLEARWQATSDDEVAERIAAGPPPPR